MIDLCHGHRRHYALLRPRFVLRQVAPALSAGVDRIHAQQVGIRPRARRRRRRVGHRDPHRAAGAERQRRLRGRAQRAHAPRGRGDAVEASELPQHRRRRRGNDARRRQRRLHHRGAGVSLVRPRAVARRVPTDPSQEWRRRRLGGARVERPAARPARVRGRVRAGRPPLQHRSRPDQPPQREQGRERGAGALLRPRAVRVRHVREPAVARLGRRARARAVQLLHAAGERPALPRDDERAARVLRQAALTLVPRLVLQPCLSTNTVGVPTVAQRAVYNTPAIAIAMFESITQRRYLIPFRASRLPQQVTDVLVIGGGVAGLRSAIAAAAGGAEVLLLCKDTVEQSNTWYAQGGIAAVLQPLDSVEAHVRDTELVGVGLCDESAVRIVVEEGPRRVLELLSWGANFDRQAGNAHDLAFGLEGGHSYARILHAYGDATGKELAQTLINKVRSFDSVRVSENSFAIDLITH